MNPNIKANEIVSAFKRYIANGETNEIYQYKLKDLLSVNEQYGDRDLNSGPRTAINNRIKDLELKESRSHAGRVRAWQLIATLVVGVAIGGLIIWLFKT